MSEQNPQLDVVPRNKPCIMCGNNEYIWGGTLIDVRMEESDRGWVYFRPDGATYEDGDMVLNARLCQVCGNVQWLYD